MWVTNGLFIVGYEILMCDGLGMVFLCAFRFGSEDLVEFKGIVVCLFLDRLVVVGVERSFVGNRIRMYTVVDHLRA